MKVSTKKMYLFYFIIPILRVNLEKATFYKIPIMKWSEGTSKAAWCVWKKEPFVTCLCYITMYIMSLKGCLQGTLLESVDEILVSLNITVVKN